MNTGKLLGISLVAILAMPVQAAEVAGPVEEIQAYCDEQADAAGLVGGEDRAAFVKMCVDSETRTAAAEGKGGGDD